MGGLQEADFKFISEPDYFKVSFDKGKLAESRKIEEGQTVTVEIELKDDQGNSRTVQLNIKFNYDTLQREYDQVTEKTKDKTEE